MNSGPVGSKRKRRYHCFEVGLSVEQNRAAGGLLVDHVANQALGQAPPAGGGGRGDSADPARPVG